MPGSTAWIRWNVPVRFVSTIFHQSSAGCSTNGLIVM
jgi:hypothetical protein